MKVEPYEPFTIRNKRIWEEIAQKLGVNTTILRLVRVKSYYYISFDTYDFFQLILNPKKEGICEKIRQECQNLQESMTPEEIEKEQKEFDRVFIDVEFSDLMNYRLKALIEIGDQWECRETKHYTFSKIQYMTAGKKYKILSLDDDRKSFSDFSFTTTTDLDNGIDYHSAHSCRSIWRDGKEIWNWHQAYLDLWIEQNPNHPDTKQFTEYCKEQIQIERDLCSTN